MALLSLFVPAMIEGMRRRLSATLLLLALCACRGPHVDWRTRVPPAERARANPLAEVAPAVAAGASLYRAHCVKCHGVDGNGRAGRPGLRTDRVAAESDGELFWILRNGARAQGMPAWDGLGDEHLWQLVAYLRTLRPATTPVPR